MCSSIEDLKIAYRIIAAPDPSGPPSTSFPHPRHHQAPLTVPKKRMVGIYKQWFEDCAAEVYQPTQAAVEALEAQGYEIVYLPSIPYLSMARSVKIAVRQ